jgi:amino acid transporter
MADDGLFFRRVASVHPRFGTPSIAILLAAALGVVFVLLQTFEQLADTFVTAIVPFYALAVAAIFVVRKRPNYDPPFRTPLYPIVPALFILATCFLLGNALLDSVSRWPTLAVLLVILLGVPVYYATVRRLTPQRA